MEGAEEVDVPLVQFPHVVDRGHPFRGRLLDLSVYGV